MGQGYEKREAVCSQTHGLGRARGSRPQSFRPREWCRAVTPVIGGLKPERGHRLGGLHRCLAPLPAPGLKLGPLKVACVGVALVEGWGTSLGRCPDRVSGLGSAGVLLTRPGLESCRRLSPRRGLALTPPPLRSSTNRARWARTARSSSPTSPPEWVALDSSRHLLLPLVRDAPSAGVGGHPAGRGLSWACPGPICAAPWAMGSQMGPTSDAWGQLLCRVVPVPHLTSKDSLAW